MKTQNAILAEQIMKKRTRLSFNKKARPNTEKKLSVLNKTPTIPYSHWTNRQLSKIPVV